VPYFRVVMLVAVCLAVVVAVPALALPRTPLDRPQSEPGTRPPNVRV
jgi:hypothetical protein